MQCNAIFTPKYLGVGIKPFIKIITWSLKALVKIGAYGNSNSNFTAEFKGKIMQNNWTGNHANVKKSTLTQKKIPLWTSQLHWIKKNNITKMGAKRKEKKRKKKKKRHFGFEYEK